MRSETARRIVRYGLLNYMRNGWLSVAATLVLSLTLFIMSVFLMQTYVIRSETEALRDKLDMAIYLNDEPTEEQVSTFIKEVQAYPEIREVVYLNKQLVIEQWNQTQANQKIKDLVSVENNPLPRTVKVKAHDPAQLETIATKVTASPFAPSIRKVSYQDNRQIIQQLAARSQKTIKNGIIVSSIFIIIAILFVYNTIRLIIQFRQEEISIMKLVGATDSFVRGPFVIEGTLYGIVAGLITLPALYFFLRNGLQESSTIVSSTDALLTNQLVNFFVANIAIIGALLIGVAVFIAISCSWVSVRRHLRH